MERIITVFGSSRPRENEADYEEAMALGQALGEAGFAVCSGGYGGVMEAVSRGARAPAQERMVLPRNFSSRRSIGGLTQKFA